MLVGIGSFAAAVIFAAIATLAARAITVEAIIAILTLWAILGGGILAGLGQLLLALVAVIFIIALAPRLVLVLEPRAAFAEQAEIMVRKLQIIFGLDTVSRKLGVARHALVFLKQLGGIAALTIVLAVARLSTEVPCPALSTTAASAAALSIVDQMPTSLRSVC
jgi:hypothetical protein